LSTSVAEVRGERRRAARETTNKSLENILENKGQHQLEIDQRKIFTFKISYSRLR
jgi:hypothetical protein